MESNWLWLVPTATAQASYSPVIFLLVIVAVMLLTFLLVRRFYHGRVRLAAPWDCGFPAQTSRMQDTADAFGQPIRHVFGPVFLHAAELPAPDDAAPRYRARRSRTGTGTGCTCPSRGWPPGLSSKIGLLQQGRISIYLLYSFVTLIALLVFVR